MDKMTFEEFKAILSASGLDFDVMGWEGILNHIGGYQGHLGMSLERSGMKKSSELFHKTADYIHDTLKSRGYYDNI